LWRKLDELNSLKIKKTYIFFKSLQKTANNI
jgi:hypothetical protein